MSYYYKKDHRFKFLPTDEEVINDYLIEKLKNKPCGDFIVMKDVYAKEPWLLDHTNDPFFMEDEWYYFVRRTQVSDKKMGCGKNVKRKITGDEDGIDRGNWKMNAKEDIIDEKTRKIIGIKQTLTFNKKSNNNNNKKKQKIGCGAYATHVWGSDSSWIMTEYVLPDTGRFQELVVCKIHVTKNSKKKEDHHEASTSTYYHGESSSSSEQQPISEAHQRESVLPSSLTQQPINIDHEINKSKNVEAMKTWRPSVDQEQCGEGNIPIALERCENSGSEQAHINTRVCLGHESSLPIRSEQEAQEGSDWIQDMFDQYAALCFTKGSQLS